MDFDTLNELYATDEDKALNGVKIEIGVNKKDNPISVTVAESGNQRHQKVQRKYSKALEFSRRNTKKHDLVWAKITAESILMDWSGMIDKDGNEQPATIENKIKALAGSDKFFSTILEIANTPENFRPDDTDSDSDLDLDPDLSPQEDSEKNLARTLNGAVTTEKV
jgi:hypothetical protein